MANKPSTHPDFGELEAHRRGEADAAIADHVGRCALCQLNLKELDDLATLVREEAAALPAVPEDIEKRILWNARQNAARVRKAVEHRAPSTEHGHDQTNSSPEPVLRVPGSVFRRALGRSAQRWAIAASLLLAVGAVAVWRQVNRSAPQAKLDIVDAFTLARRLASAQASDRRYDINHDGRVDDADVERMARQAVALGET